MTNTLHENGHWVQDNKLNLVENSSADRSSTMERNSTQSTSNHINNNQQETMNGTNEDDFIENEDEISIVSDDEFDSANEEEQEIEREHNSSVPYNYTGHLGTTSPGVLKHIDEAIENVVKHFQISKSDLASIKNDLLNSQNEQSTSLLATCSTTGHIANRSTSSNHNNNSKLTKSTIPETTKKRRRRKKKKTNDFHAFDTDQQFELKKKKVDVKKKDNLIGPFIRIETKKNQTNYTVINSSTRLEDKESKQFIKPNYGSIAKSKSSNQVLFQQNDSTWICVFCKRQPHYKQLGDLFGPHELIGDKNISDYNCTNGLSLITVGPTPSSSSHLNISNNNSTTKNEIWFHEDCIIWSNGIYLAGNRVRNIDEVVLECFDMICSGCKLKGANLGCVHKGCNQTFHFICAKENGCELDEESFSMFCQQHHKKSDDRPQTSQ